jgi:hypothetical protein
MPTTGGTVSADAGRFALHERMMAEARAIVDAAREDGALLRLTGGLAVRRYCTDLGFADRDYGDIDLVGRSSQIRIVLALFERFGFLEDVHVTQATQGTQRQFCPRRAPASGVTDHVDVFFDQMAMDHVIDLRDRLTLDDYAISAGDALLTKLQIFRLNHKDMHDVIALVKDVPLARDERPRTINVRYVADLCAEDWGLHTDVQANIEKCLAGLSSFDLTDADYDRVKSALTALVVAMSSAAKTLRWRLRARVGRRMAWHREVEEQGGRTAADDIWGGRG